MTEQVYRKMSTDFILHKFDGDVGSIEAMVTTYRNTDVVKDVMAPGVLDKYISQFNKTEDNRLPMLFQHSLTNIIGEWTKFEGTEDGVKGYGNIYTETTVGSDVRSLIQRGMVGAVSIGFVANDYEKMDNGGLLFKEIELREVSAVSSPANPKALITSAKNADGTVDMRKLEKALRDAGLTRKESREFIYHGKDALRDAIVAETERLQFLVNLKHNLRSI